jgi:pectate lyase
MIVLPWLSFRLLSLYIHALVMGFIGVLAFDYQVGGTFYANLRVGWASISSSSVEGAALGFNSSEGFHSARRCMNHLWN